MAPSDERWMAALAADDPGALEALMERHGGGVFRFLFVRFGNRVLAEDLTQEVFLAVYRARHRYAAKAKFTTWLYRIARNQAMKATRDSKHAVHPAVATAGEERPWNALPGGAATAGRGDSPELTAERRERAGQVWAAMRDLPAPVREVVSLRLLADLEFPRIAEVLEIPASTAKDRLSKGLSLLRAALTGPE